MKKLFLLFPLLLLLFSHQSLAQNKLEFEGQASTFGSYSPDASPDGLIGGRYIPQLNFQHALNPSRSLFFEASVNMYASVSSFNFNSFETTGKIQPYRIWGRYTGKQFEIRLGLQKIDFGSATLLRPLQWFNQIDPRDPLKLTNGVYGALGRYYFLNNANIWLWMLFGNEKTRGFDVVKTNKNLPEFGGRIQYPVPKGELAASYHHRIADSREILAVPSYSQIPEDRFALDGKWDVVIGLWFEATHIHKYKDIGILTNQTLLNVGADYTFGIGNGLNVVAEHLVMSLDEKPFRFKNNSNITASTIAYPLGLFDNLSSILYYSWDAQSLAVFINYQHQFKKITGYVMGYYNPGSQQGIQENELLTLSSGPGIRIMLVYNR